MALQVEDLDDERKYRQKLVLSYDELIPFIIDYFTRRTLLTYIFWSVCFVFIVIAVSIRVRISGYYPQGNIMLHSLLGIAGFPLLSVPLHEGLHIIPYYLYGARKIRIGMDLSQYLFYVTAHKHVLTPRQFRLVALLPFLMISLTLIICIIILPGIWKWSVALFLFSHATMCAGDFALLNFYFINRGKKIYTWDDADKKVAYFYEEIE
jgi:hypothetical protein